MEPIKCPKCGAIVKVTANRFPDCEWKCLMCGESGSIKQGLTSGYIQKVGEADSKSTACDIPGKPFLQQGWQCPKCGAILAPYQSYCPFCSKKESDWITTVGTGQYTNPNPSTSIS